MHSLSLSLFACLCAPLSFSPCLSLWTVCTPGCTSAFVLPACRFALSLRLTPFPSSASLNAQRPAHPVSLSAAGLSLSYSQSRSLSLFARLPFIVSLSLFLSQDFLSGLMCAGASCPISPRARWATKDFLSGLTCAGASCPISPRARWATEDFPNAPHALRRVVQICLIFIF